MTSFADNFWGEKNNGFFLLYHNMKYGQTASKEFIEFLRESCTLEENYGKLLNKLAKNVSNCIHERTFSPFWNLLKSLVEKLSTLHMQLVYTWSELIKDVVRYSDEQHKRHKSMKESESSTLEIVQSMQQTTTALHKAKEIYRTRCSELEQLKRENTSQKDMEKAEVKFKKASEEYRMLVEKYASVRKEFERKMTESCHHFQELEEEHICQMKDFIDTYAKAWENEHVLLGQVHREFRINCDELTVQKLLDTFIKAKSTGTIRPGPKEFVEPDLSTPPPARPLSPEPLDKKDNMLEKQKREGFLKTRREKKNKKKKKKEKDSESVNETDNVNEITPELQVDDEGFSKRPDNPFEFNGDKNNWYSTESDSDSDGDETKKKIKVEIRPLSPNGTTSTGTVEDIRASIEGLRLSPTAVKRRSQTPIDKKMKRSQSESDTLDSNKPSHDLLHLHIFNSSASTPTGVNYNLPSPLSPQTETAMSGSSTTLSSSNTSDFYNHDCTATIQGNKPSTPSSHATSPVGPFNLPTPPIPRPASRNKTPLPQAMPRPGRISPAPAISQMDNFGNVTFSTTPMSLGLSRGSSPLTLGMSDVIPMAVAFTETINAYFKGTDATKCVVKIGGSLMMSFPAGIIRVFTENPSPAMLSFRLKGAENLEQVLENKDLIAKDEGQSTVDSFTYTFDMSALTDHLKQQGEQNKSASYFNIDILKYQAKSIPGVDSTPLPLVVYWKCSSGETNYRLDYKYNASSMSSPVFLKSIVATVVLNGDVQHMQSIPNGNWNAEEKRATWKIDDISEVSENGSQGCIRAKFSSKSGVVNPTTTALQFISEGATLSKVDFELADHGYRLSLVKKRFATGKYLADPDPEIKYL